MIRHRDRDRREAGADRRPDRTAIGRVLEACRGHLERRARRLIPPAMRAKVGASDLVQEAFVDAARRVGEMPSAGRSDEVRAWLYRIMALNLAEQRRRYLGTARADVSREVRLEATPGLSGAATLRERLADAGESPSGLVRAREAEDRLSAAIAALPDVEREVVVWRYWDRLDYAEIGRRLGGRSADAARMVHARACRRMYRDFGGEGS